MTARAPQAMNPSGHRVSLEGRLSFRDVLLGLGTLVLAAIALVVAVALTVASFWP
jgi:hypothetical protein